jgi:hypothetical protein
MAITDVELAVLVKITGTFENSGDPYRGVAGDFDGQGISCGVLQWNIGQTSLQPLVKDVGKNVVLNNMPAFGNELWDACHAPLAGALAAVRLWQTGSSLHAVPKRELRDLMGSPEMRARQDVSIRAVGKAAEEMCDQWVADRSATSRTIQELCWFFDIVTQNSSLKGLRFSDVENFKNAAAPGKADDLVCDWLAQTTSIFAGQEDCHKNAALWLNQANGLGLDLLIISYLRSQKSILRWRGDVLNRKGALALKQGWVHKQLFDLTSDL